MLRRSCVHGSFNQGRIQVGGSGSPPLQFTAENAPDTTGPTHRKALGRGFRGSRTPGEILDLPLLSNITSLHGVFFPNNSILWLRFL